MTLQRATRTARPALLVGVLAAIVGSLAAVHYYSAGLTLTHYDARGHLVVARRIVDSLTPGWQQIGAVWLPLPHLLNAAPVQIDALYRSGASGVAWSVLAFATASAGIAHITLITTGSRGAALVGSLVFVLNPNVLYLQATPMTEPLLVGFMVCGVALLMDWCRSPDHPPKWIGPVFALACLTRYEAWPVTLAALLLAAVARRRAGDSLRAVADRIGGMAAWPAAAVVAFLVFSRVVIGAWFVAGGFFVPENDALGDAVGVVRQVVWGVRELSGGGLVWVAGAGLTAMSLLAVFDRRRSHLAVALALGATAALPLLAFYDGHPYRIRYMVPLMAVQAVGAGAAAGLLRRGQPVAVLAVLAMAVFELRPLDPAAPMVREAQWDRPNVSARQQVTDCLRAQYDNDTVMASMGSLGHYMQEMSRSGFRIRDFLHEGNGDIWLAALEGAAPYAGWVMVEELAEGGDLLSGIARENPRFLKGFSRACEGAGVALYKRDASRIRTEG